MEYEKIILELLVRVKNLEEKVDALTERLNAENTKQPGTADIKKYVIEQKQTAKANGLSTVTLKANDIHKALKLKSRMPAVCTAMKQCMEDGDRILHETASGFSSTFEVLYYLK